MEKHNSSTVVAHSLFTEYDIYLFKQGKHYRLYEKLGAHPVRVGGQAGVYFSVYAPHASYVSVVCDANFWDKGTLALFARGDGSGIWEGWVAAIEEGVRYKYYIVNGRTQEGREKIDPFAQAFEVPPKTASVVRKVQPRWTDASWMQQRHRKGLDSAISVYEVHIGSWKRVQEGRRHRSLSYAELADELVQYVKEMHYTHVELMPITEHPYDLSWGYQSLGFFAPTARFGSPEEFAYLVDTFHRHDIGVLLDFVPSHFPCDAHGLYKYDGTSIFEYDDPFQEIHPDWKSAVFDYACPFVRSFLISAALYWLEQYHIDGLRVDAVASMLYLDYSRKEGEWRPNMFGNNINLEAVDFLKILNETVFGYFPDVHMIAEESTAWAGVSRPTYVNGLGFNMKWMMGWMHDVLHFMQRDSLFRSYHYHELTFSFLYFTHENFMLPLSHDEVVHGKGSLMDRMAGDYWQKFANLRLLFSYMFFHPGTKLSFMGNEIAQFNQWDVNKSIEWHLLEFDSHRGIQSLIKRLNSVYRSEAALHKNQFSHDTVEWIINNDAHQAVIAFIRKVDNQAIIIIGNFTPEVRYIYRIGIHQSGTYTVLFNSDDTAYYGSGVGDKADITSEAIAAHGRPHSLVVTLPPLAFIALKQVDKKVK